MHKGHLLDQLETDLDRAILCRRWAEEARNAYYAGKERAQKMSAGHGDMWGKSVLAQDLKSLEQMYHRWMMGYLEWHRIGQDR